MSCSNGTSQSKDDCERVGATWTERLEGSGRHSGGQGIESEVNKMLGSKGGRRRRRSSKASKMSKASKKSRGSRKSRSSRRRRRGGQNKQPSQHGGQAAPVPTKH